MVIAVGTIVAWILGPKWSQRRRQIEWQDERVLS